MALGSKEGKLHVLAQSGNVPGDHHALPLFIWNSSHDFHVQEL